MNMIDNAWRLAHAGVLAMASWPAFAGLQVQSPALFAPDATFVESVRKECELEHMIGNHVVRGAQEQIAGVSAVTEVTRLAHEPYARVTILSQIGVGGGGWSGPKLISIRVDLVEGTRVVASRVFRDRVLRGSPFAGTCKMMDNIGDNLGNDAGEWLAQVGDFDQAASLLSKGAGTRKHAKPVPAASGFAAATDVKAVPLSDAGKARYQHYLSLPAPKAFAISEDGLWRIVANDAKAVPRVLEACVSRGYACSLYAVDDQVVWHDDAAKRVGLPAPSNAAALRNPAPEVKPAASAASDNGSQ